MSAGQDPPGMEFQAGEIERVPERPREDRVLYAGELRIRVSYDLRTCRFEHGDGSVVQVSLIDALRGAVALVGYVSELFVDLVQSFEHAAEEMAARVWGVRERPAREERKSGD